MEVDAWVRTQIIDCVAAAVAMGSDEIEEDKAFSDYGVDSIVGLQLINAVNDRFGITLRTTILFDYATVEELAHYLQEQNKHKIIEAWENNTQKSKKEETHDWVEKEILDCVSMSLDMRHDEIDENKAFSEYGVDSIVGLQLISSINQRFGITLRTTILFDYTTVKELAYYLQEQHFKDNKDIGIKEARRVTSSVLLPEDVSKRITSSSGMKKAISNVDATELELLESLSKGDITINQFYRQWNRYSRVQRN